MVIPIWWRFFAAFICLLIASHPPSRLSLNWWALAAACLVSTKL